MEKIAIIDRIENNTIYATYNMNSSGGHSKAFFKVKEDLTFKIKNTKELNLGIGDSVEIFIEPKNAIAVCFLLFIMPLILFIFFYSFTGILAKNIPEFIKIIFGILGIVTSFVITAISLKIHPQKLPEIIKILPKAETTLSTCSTCGSCKSCN